MGRGGIMVATSTILLITMQRLTIVGGIAAAVMAITGMQMEEEEVRRVQVVGCEVADERVWAASWVKLTVDQPTDRERLTVGDLAELAVALPWRLVELEGKFHSRWVTNIMVKIVTS